MSKTNIASTWIKNLHGLRKDERGAESTEVILVLVLLVIGLVVAWMKLKDKIMGRINQTGDCLDVADQSAADNAC